MKLVRHYKGGLYIEVARALESTNERQGREVVVYFSLEKQTWHTRDAEEFDGVVDQLGPMKYRFMPIEAS